MKPTRLVCIGLLSLALACGKGKTATLVFVSQPVTNFQGEILAPVVVEARDSKGNKVNTSGSVTLSGAGLAGTLTVSAVSGRATFSDLHVDTEAAGDVLTASASGATSSKSSAFDVKGLHLQFDVAPPTHAMAGTVYPIQVSFRAPDGQLAAIARAVSLSLQPSGTLSGTTTRTSVGGVATFDDVALTSVGGDMTIQASARNAAAATTQIMAALSQQEIEQAGTNTNDTPATAETIQPGVPLAGTLPAGDKDWFRFHASAGQVLTASTYAGRYDPSHWDNDIRLRLVAPDGATELWRTEAGLEWNSAIDRGFTAVSIPADGDYYLVAEQHDGTMGGKYALLLTLASPSVQTETEGPNGGGNDTRATAQAIVPGTVRGFFEGAPDYYRISVAAPSRVRLELNAGRNGAANGGIDYWDTLIAVEDASGDLSTAGTRVWQNDDGVFYDSSIDFVFTTGGTYYVRLDTASAPAPTSYLLTYDAQPWSPTADGSTNLSVNSAMQVAYGQAFGSNFTAADSRYYKFSGHAGDRVRVRAFDQNNLQGSAVAAVPGIYDATGSSALPISDQNYPVHVQQTLLPADGTYVIRVDNANSGTGSFGLMLELVGQTSREVEPNDDAAHATAFPSGGKVSGTIGAAGDHDMFSFHAEAGQLMSVSLFANGGNNDADWEYAGYGSTLSPRLEIRDASGNTVVTVGLDQAPPYAESAVRPDPTVEASFLAPAAGTYYAVVTDVDPSAGGASRYYVLELLQNR